MLYIIDLIDNQSDHVYYIYLSQAMANKSLQQSQLPNI